VASIAARCSPAWINRAAELLRPRWMRCLAPGRGLPWRCRAAVLTGWGRTGCAGGNLKAHGASVLAQDEASSVVWGCRGGGDAGLADRVLPLDQVVPESCEGRACAEGSQMVAPTITEGIHSDNYRFPAGVCLFEAGIVLEHDKHYLFESRSRRS